MAKRCENGHFYDGDKYAFCPYCSAGAVQRNEESNVTQSLTATDLVGLRINPNFESQPTESTTDFVNANTAPNISSFEVGPSADVIMRQQAVTLPAANRPVDFASAMHNAVQNTTLGPTVGDDNPTRRLGGVPGLNDEPVVGWLIGLSGEYFGECFELKSGKNFIGRSSEMDVVLAADSSVSRSRHAIVVYEPHGKIFIVQPGDSRELFYVNSDVVLGNMTLNAYDIMTIGNTKLMFFPLCGEQFSWEALEEGTI